MVEPRASGLDPGPVAGPHGSAGILEGGAEVGDAALAVVLVHGRGGSAAGMLSFAADVDVGEVVFVAPQAAGSTWYPDRFVAPLERNQPWLDSALDLLGAVGRALSGEGIPAERQVFAGFSQGGCLALEWGIRNAGRHGGLVGLSAGLVGPPGTTWEPDGSLDGAPVFLGCGDPDPHIPRPRVEESARALEEAGGAVDVRIYAGLGHAVNADEIAAVRSLLESVAGR